MAKLSKRIKAFQDKADPNKVYTFDSALAIVKECATAKFNESIDISVQLGVDPKKSDQVVRGSVVLPAGTGKSVRVAVFATGEKAEQAKAAGADVVGMEDLAEQVKAGNMPFDIVIASPDTMRIVDNCQRKCGNSCYNLELTIFINRALLLPHVQSMSCTHKKNPPGDNLGGFRIRA